MVGTHTINIFRVRAAQVSKQTEVPGEQSVSVDTLRSGMRLFVDQFVAQQKGCL